MSEAVVVVHEQCEGAEGGQHGGVAVVKLADVVDECLADGSDLVLGRERVAELVGEQRLPGQQRHLQVTQ